MTFLLGIVTGVVLSAFALIAYSVGICWWLTKDPE